MNYLRDSLRNRKVLLALLRSTSFVMAGLFLYIFGAMFSGLTFRMRVCCILSFLCIMTGFLNMYAGVRDKYQNQIVFSYIVTTVGLLVFEIGILVFQ